MLRLWIFLLLLVANVGLAADEDSKRRQASALLNAIDAERMLLQAQFKLQGQYSHLLKDYRIPIAKRPLEEQFRKRAFDFARQTMSWEQLEPPIVEAYSQQYSEEELASLTAFFASDTGQKFLKTQPQLAASVDQLVNQQLQMVNGQFANLIEEFVLQAGLTQQPVPSHGSAVHISPKSRPIAPPSKPTHNVSQ
ncbi:DUF2059 domain-containing protein [Shewanella sp. KX20019]|uniref:DUF2059 domain-containing protein n=1 Tax=Shewanella sp. KX20019 TaxID=2803864 RepID=UPI0019259FC0|nr:DUF2059 domain-containing protein [Shewanella sp. KX20019]QQX81291.1 DUF2059 domain-containing protein [Shewanella sp. KX20019]